MKNSSEVNSIVQNQSEALADQLHAIFQAFPDLLFRMDTKGIILEYRVGNPSLLHLSTEKIIGRSLRDALPASVAQKYQKGIEQVNQTKRIVSFDYWRKLKWENRCFETRLVQLPSTDIIAIVRDITEQKQTEEQLRHQLQKLAALRLIDTAISSSYDLNLTLIVILSQITSQLNVDAADILLQNNTSQTLDYAGGRGFWTETVQHAHLRIGEGLAGQAALEKRILQIPDINELKTESLFPQTLAKEKFISYVGVPLIAKGQVRGVLEIFNRSKLSPDTDWMNLLETLSGQAAIAIDNASMLADLQQSHTDLAQAYDGTIEGWARAMELRDRETQGHTQRVTKLTLRLARLLGMDEKLIVHVRRGALLHDIGKMSLPDSILFKPGPLSEEELEIMHQHPIYAMKMLSTIPYLKPALDIPVYHHEKWDGNGYPYGLKGDNIPFAARIFAVADVYDALTSERPYRKAVSHEEAIGYIHNQSGSHFDPKVVPIALREIKAKAVQTG